jgi:hypothetical protein
MSCITKNRYKVSSCLIISAVQFRTKSKHKFENGFILQHIILLCYVKRCAFKNLVAVGSRVVEEPPEPHQNLTRSRSPMPR